MSSGLIPAGFTVIGQLVAPSGTRIPFNQPAAPLGWSQETGAAYSDCSLRVNNSSPTTGGAAAWSTWNQGGTVNFNNITLTSNQLPAHNHNITGEVAHSHTISGGTGQFYYVFNGGGLGRTTGATSPNTTGYSTTGVASAGLSLSATGTGNPITPTITTPLVKYTDMIIGIKS